MLLTEEQRLIRDTARQFADSELAPFAATWDRDATFPAGAIRALAELGFMGMTIPVEHGGAGADYVSYALAIEEIARGDGSVSTIMSVQNSPCCAAVFQSGSESQKQRFLGAMARGEQLACFGLTESQAGSDASALRTRARRTDSGYVIDGTKQFITSGANADIALVFAVTDPDKGQRGISAFIVATDHPGYRVASIEHKLGQRASDTAALVFESLEVDDDCLLGEEGEGYRIALANLEAGRIGIAAQSVGMAQAAFDAALAYAKERQTFGKPIVDHQAVSFRLADMDTRIQAARQLVLHAAAMRDAGLPCLKQACQAKLFASEMAETVCSDAIQIHGGYGYLNDFPVERIYRDVRVCQIYEGTSDVQRMVIARELKNASG